MYELINRSQYLQKLINVIGTPDIKVIIGVRRSGKSKLLEAFKSHIEKDIPDCNIIHINFNLPEYEHLLEYRPLYDYINSKYESGQESFVLIDEVQMCTDFETTYLGNQLEYEFGGSRCFGIAANMDFILISTHEENGENPELVI